MKTKKKIRVGIVTSTYAREDQDCQVPWMRELNARLKPDVEHLVVMAPSYKGLKEHKIDGVKVKRFRYAPESLETLTHDEGAPNKVRSLGYKLLAIPYLLCGILAVFLWCMRERITVLHVHWPFPHAVWAILPKVLLGVRVVAMSHGAELAIARRSPLVRYVLGGLLRTADVCCANSSHTAQEVKTVSGCIARITPYGATVEASPEQAELTHGDKVPTLLFCGRLIQRKGIDVLLHALPMVLKRRKVNVVITGEGDRKAEWEALSQRLGLEPHVRFAGFVSNEELAGLYRNCSAYVHPAIYDDRGDTEGLGVVLIEALANRKPVIASGVGGIVDVIRHEETGLLVPEKNPTALADAIEKVLSNPALAKELGENGLAHVHRFFDWERISELTQGIYKEVLSEERGNTADQQNVQRA